MRFIIMFITTIITIYCYGCTTEWRGLYARFISAQKYDRAIKGLTIRAQKASAKEMKFQYWLLAGIAYRKKRIT